jgi:hypothetical protein
VIDPTKLTRHQQRILAALRALTERHGCRWWPREAIGRVVFGFGPRVQLRSMSALKRLGLVQTEHSAMPCEIRDVVRCNCACWHWGLTEAGRQLAASMRIVWSAERETHIKGASVYAVSPERQHDEDEARRRFLDGDTQ